MPDQSPLEQAVARVEQDAREFQQDVRQRLMPPETDTRTPAQTMADGYAASQREREGEREGEQEEEGESE